MNKRILFSVLTIGAVLAMVGGATVAYFFESDTATGNVLSAGILEMKIGKDSGSVDKDTVTGAFTATELEPGVEKDAGEICYGNHEDSTMSGQFTVSVTNFAEADDYRDDWTRFEHSEASGGTDVGATPLAKRLFVTTAETRGTLDWTPSEKSFYWAKQIVQEAYSGDWTAAESARAVAKVDGNWVPTVWGLTKIDIYLTAGYNGPFVEVKPGHKYCTSLAVTLDPEVNNDYQFDGLSADVEVTLEQYIAP